MDKCPQGVRNEERIVALERDAQETKEYIKAILNDIKEIHDTLLGRPSWIITCIITLLSSLSVGLIVRMFMHNQ